MLSDEVVAKVEAILREDRRIPEIPGVPEISADSVHKIVTEKLGFNEVCTWWVPHMLTAEHKAKHANNGDGFLDSIVMSDETWFCGLAPSDYHLLLKLEDHLSGMKFSTNDEVEEEVTGFLNGLAVESFEEGFQKWKVCL